MSFQTPILLLTYNRPHLAERVFEAIREQEPSRLYIAADGPRANRVGDAEKCQQVRTIAGKVDWDCQVQTFFLDENLGCKLAVSSAIDWFFKQEEEGIILEDDCLPHTDFFRYCEELLAYYRQEEKVWMISGTNQIGHYETRTSFHFAHLGSVWGWATWKRAWRHYDVNMNDWPQNQNVFENHFSTELAQQRKAVTEKTYQGHINTWDYQWAYAMVKNGGLSVVPSVNLVENIGFGEDATHTEAKPEGLYNKTDKGIGFPLKYPAEVVADRNFDNEVYNRLKPKVGWKGKLRKVLGI